MLRIWLERRYYTVLPPDLLAELGCDVNTPNRIVSIAAAGGMIKVPIIRVPWFSGLGQRVELFSVLAILRTIHEHSLLWHGLKPHSGPLLRKEREVC
jgi:hypothetical protein